LVERGRRPALASPVHDEKAMLFDKAPYDDRIVTFNSQRKRLYMGGVMGGGTALYGAALLRPSKDDFHPGRHYGNRIPRAIWDWPIQYEDLAPYYLEAEQLYGVARGSDDNVAPLERSPLDRATAQLPLHPINSRLMAANRRSGLRPFRLPLAIDASRCLQCSACAGFICPTGARSASSHLLDRADQSGLPLQTLCNVEVESLQVNSRGAVDSVRMVDRTTGKQLVKRARRYVLAAGAIGSSAILLRSGLKHATLGRNYMFHLSPVVAGLFVSPTGAEESFVKQVGFADYYFGTSGYQHKLGLIQSLPVPGPLMTAKMAPGLPTGAVAFLRKRMLPLVGIVEDLPDPANQVTCEEPGQIRVKHRFGRYDLARGRRLARWMVQILKRAGAFMCVSKHLSSNEHVAHQCGTIRFGVHADHAALGPDCRMFKCPNLFIADGSFFPTSLGVGPALTIMANALRVANIVAAEV
jgi:choline dehydrogenase-like flavoprotein